MKRVAVINVVGLTESLIGEHTPRISAFRQAGGAAKIVPAFPAVTCTAQSTYLTGSPPSYHGIVGNGWYNRELAQVQFWKQSNHLVIWAQTLGGTPRAGFEVYLREGFLVVNMYSSADYSITPRPAYQADGRKVFDIYTWPYSIRTEVKRKPGRFSVCDILGSGRRQTDAARSTRCRVAMDCGIGEMDRAEISADAEPDLLPHLDYNLQRFGPFAASEEGSGPPNAPVTSLADAVKFARRLNPVIVPDLRAIDSIVGDLVDFFSKQGVQLLLLSEYGITNANWPVHLNRILRSAGFLTVKDELGLEVLDCGASKAFAVADHQVAHIYLNDPSVEKSVRELIEKQEGVERVLGKSEKIALGLAHPRAGDLIAVASENAWFTYYYWMEDKVAPDFARTVDIHRKPGYDPVELFVDPAISLPTAKIAWRLMQKKLGFRMLMDVISLEATLVKGSHGCRSKNPADYPVLISQQAELLRNPMIEATDVYHVLKRHLA